MSVLFTTVCNDRYTNALALLLWSIKHHNPGFNFPLKVYHKGDLSEPRQQRIRQIYPPAFFEDVSKQEYQAKIPHYLALETFREFAPDLVVFIDSDIICLGDISALARLDQPLCAALDYDFKNSFAFNARFPFSRLARINTGVFALNKTHRNPETYAAIYGLLDKFPAKREKGMLWSDQGVMNLHFRHATKHIFPYFYNARKNLFPNPRFKHGREAALRNVRLLHFGGTCKPFLGGLKNIPPGNKHHKYSQLHEVYYDYWARLQRDLQVDWVLDENA
jgi:lipopolysaccharide biosynthesis glycosyltransferase